MARGRVRADVLREERGAHPPVAPRGDRGAEGADRQAARRRPLTTSGMSSRTPGRRCGRSRHRRVPRCFGSRAVTTRSGSTRCSSSTTGSSNRSRRSSNRGARVVAAGLAQDFRGEPFGSMPTLLCVAEFVDKLEAVCHRCGGPATLTQRLVDGHPAPYDGATVQIGALDSYEARCRHCHSVSQPGWLDGLAEARARAS